MFKDVTTFGKKLSSKIERRHHKVQISIAIRRGSLESLLLTNRNELFNQYNVCDWSCYLRDYKIFKWYKRNKQYKVWIK